MMQLARRFARHLGARAGRPAFALRATRRGFRAAQQAATARISGEESFDAATGYLADTLAVFQQWNDESLTAAFDDHCEFDQNYPALEL